MSTSARFLQLVNSSYINNDISSMRDAFYNWQDTNCLNPVSVRVTDNHTQTLRTIQVPCGKCWHCQQTKINEWCTRMYAHAEDFKHVYFVTLTYRSVSNVHNDVNKLLLNKLGQAVWHRDSLNYTHHLCYRPCLLVKKHYQDFLKRLRKNTGLDDITYVVSGEYGHDYGGPHFHFVFFTNGVLTREDIVRAWSVCLWRDVSGIWSYRRNQKYNGTAYNFPIGRVDFNDLVTNGTFNKDFAIRVDGTYMNAANCFAYVCKYVVKRDTANLSRVGLAFKNLFYKDVYTKVFDNEIQYSIVKDYLRLLGYPYESIDDIYKHLKSLSYEKNIYRPSESICQYGLLRSKRVTKQNYSFTINFFPENRTEFYNSFRPFCEFSRGCPIGSVYANRNIQEFAQGVFSKPLLQTQGFCVPRYFRNKAQNYLYGLRKLRKTLNGQSLVITGLVDLQRRLNKACQDSSSLSENMGDSIPYCLITEALHDDRSLFVDAYTKERIIIYNGHAQHYRYNRHTRNYDLTRAIKVSDWIRLWCTKLQDELRRAEIKRSMSDISRSMKERADLIMLDCGLEKDHLLESYVSRQESIRNEMKKLYHFTHRSAE